MGWLMFSIQVSRPILWPILPLVYYLGLHAAGAPLSPAAYGQMLLLTFPMNLIGCGLNDAYDVESDRRSSRRRAVWGADIREQDRQRLLRVCYLTIPLVIAGSLATRN